MSKSKYLSNEERSKLALQKFDRAKVLNNLINKDSPIIFDVGANHGASIDQFKEIWPDSIIHCFEPQQECWADLENYRSQYKDNSILINKYALGSSQDEKIFYTHDISSGMSGFNKINLNSKDSLNLKEMGSNSDALNKYVNTVNHERKVFVETPENYINKKEISKINLLKIDTQGHEPEILKGFNEYLPIVDVILTELMLYDFYEKSLNFFDIEQHIIPKGFQLYDISHVSKNPHNGRTDWVDLIYINNSSY